MSSSLKVIYDKSFIAALQIEGQNLMQGLTKVGNFNKSALGLSCKSDF